MYTYVQVWDNPHAHVYIVYGCVSFTIQREFEGGIIWMSWKKHAATYQVRWNFEVWQDIEEIRYTVCMRDCWITYL